MNWLDSVLNPVYDTGVGRPLYSGGGGSAGEVGFADYIELVHTDWIGDTTGADAIDITVPAVMNSVFDDGNPTTNPNPYAKHGSEESFYEDVTDDMQNIINAYTSLTGGTGYLVNTSHGNRPDQTQIDWGQIIQNARVTVDGSALTLSAVDISALVQTIITQNITNASAVALQAITDGKSNTDTIVDGAIAKALEVLNSQAITDSITVFADKLAPEVNRIKSTFSSGMADINAVNSAAFIFGNSNIEAQYVRSIAEFTNNLINSLYNQIIISYIQSASNLSAQEINAFNNVFVNNLKGQSTADLSARQVRDSRIDNSTNLMSNMLMGNIANDMAKVGLAQNAYNTKATQSMTTKQEQLRVAVGEMTWDLQIYNAGANVLSSLNTGGGQFIPDGASQTSLTAGGALAGAVAGAKIGALSANPAGALVGAGIGLIAGAALGFQEGE